MGCVFSTECEKRIMPTCDGFRETPLRLLGYSTHLGNACSTYFPPHIANVPHMVTTAYICTDVFRKTSKSSEEGYCRTRIAINAGDAFIWQMLASVIIPGFIINKIKQITLKSTTHPPNSCAPPPSLVKALPAPILRALPCLFGIVAIPLLTYPIDKAVSLLMDATYRPMLKDIHPEEAHSEVMQSKKAKKPKPPPVKVEKKVEKKVETKVEKEKKAENPEQHEHHVKVMKVDKVIMMGDEEETREASHSNTAKA